MKSLYLFILILFSCSFALAQRDDQQKNNVQCEISVVYFGGAQKNNTLYYRKGNDAKFHPIKSRSSNVAPPKKYTGPALLTFYIKDPSKELGYTPLGTCLLNPSLSRVIILTYPTKNAKGSFKAINASAEKFPLGSRIIINRTTASIRGLYTTLPDLKTKKVSKKAVFNVKAKGKTLVLPLEPDAAPMKSHYSQIEY